MKKLLFALLLLLALPVVSLGEIDLSSMSYEELIDLQIQLSKAIAAAAPSVSEPTSGIIFKDGEFSEFKTIKYVPYDYFEAKNNPGTYKATHTVVDGVVDLVYVENDIAAVFFNVDGDSSKQILFFVEGADPISHLAEGVQLSIKCMAMGDTTEFGIYPLFPVIHPTIIEKLR